MTSLFNNLSRLFKIQGLKYVLVLVEFIQHTEFFQFLRRLFSKYQTLSSQCWIFCSWSRSGNIRFCQFQSFLFIAVIVISILLKTTFSQVLIHSQLLVKMFWRSHKEKLYRNILRPSTKNGWPSICLQAICSQLKCQKK